MPKLIVTVTCLTLYAFGNPANAAVKQAEWTLLVFMNAKNNLEPDALDNFSEIAGTGSNDDVNVLVELGRPVAHETNAAQNWSGVLRFRVTKGQDPVPSQAAVDLRERPDLSDLGSPKALQDFVDWGIHNYPAKKYMLVIWNHGQGWRFQMASDKVLQSAAASRQPSVLSSVNVDLKKAIQSTPQLGGYRAVSFDRDTGNFLYNSDIQTIAETTSASLKRPIDVIGFDACLMSMLETAYAFRNSASLLVASEELEPSAGWDYNYFLRRLTDNPNMTPLILSKTLIAGYKARYGDFHNTTLSVIDLGKVEDVSTAVSQFATKLMQADDTERQNIADSRAKMITYGANGGLRTSIDLAGFISIFSTMTKDNNIKQAAAAVRSKLQKTVIINYASAKSVKSTISKGVAIYFPASYADFQADPYHEGYLKNNNDHVVEFVKKEQWADFLNKYLH